MTSYRTLRSTSSQEGEEEDSNTFLASMALPGPTLAETTGEEEADHQPGLDALNRVPAVFLGGRHFFLLYSSV